MGYIIKAVLGESIQTAEQETERVEAAVEAEAVAEVEGATDAGNHFAGVLDVGPALERLVVLVVVELSERPLVDIRDEMLRRRHDVQPFERADERLYLIGMLGDDLAIDRLGIGQTPSQMMLHRRIKQLPNVVRQSRLILLWLYAEVSANQVCHISR